MKMESKFFGRTSSVKHVDVDYSKYLGSHYNKNEKVKSPSIVINHISLATDRYNEVFIF